MKKVIRRNELLVKNAASDECIDEYIDILKPYFNKITHHYTTNHNLNHDCILVYSYFPNEICCDNCRQKPITINISQLDSSIPIKKGFGDNRFRDEPCSRLLRIRYGSLTFGYYCVRNNMMLAADFAHVDGNQPHLKVILETLYDTDILIHMEDKRGQCEITLGTDPEMEAMVDGKIIAGNCLPSIRSNDKAYISHDGARNQRELRPDPSKSPEELVENIRDLIRISSFFGEELIIAGNNYSLGGHIHIGGAYPSAEIIEVLDYFLYPLNALSGKIRKDSQYGKMGDFRYQPHGFEYRTPPAAWLLTPELALKTLQLTKVSIETLLNTGEVIVSEENTWSNYLEDLRQFPICTEEWIEKYKNEFKWASDNLNKPLSETWGVDIPKEFRAQKKYQYSPDVEVSRVNPVRVVQLCSDDEDENGVEPLINTVSSPDVDAL